MSTSTISGLVAAIQDAMPEAIDAPVPSNAWAYSKGWNACREAVLEAIANYLNT